MLRTIGLVEELRDKEPAQQPGHAWRVGRRRQTHCTHQLPEAIEQTHLLEGRDDLRRLAQVEAAVLLVAMA